MRPLFTDGINSVVHVVLGYAFGPALILPFLAYQLLQGTPNDVIVDNAEYLTGWLLRQSSKSQ
jgi:hypothetical protein